MNPLDSAKKQKPLGKGSLLREDKILSLFDDSSPLDWEDWRWQYKNRIKSKEVLERVVCLCDEERLGIEKCGEKLNMAITPYFTSLIDPEDPHCPIRMQCIPKGVELNVSDDELHDPCGEEKFTPVPAVLCRNRMALSRLPCANNTFQAQQLTTQSQIFI